MSRLPPRPDLEWKDDGTPVSRAFNDVYFSLSDGLEETRSVFLKACGLPERWVDRTCFTIAELGFGTGLNFLGLIDCWQKSTRQPDAWLHFVSVEKFLMSADDARKALSRWPELDALSELLISRWPVRMRGLQRIEFPEVNVTLTIYIGDAEDWLYLCDFKADAWFLDGFAPAKNDDMWRNRLYGLMAKHSAPGCLVGTYTVAGHVRRGLAEAGFEVAKKPGFGRKRERLEAVWPDGNNDEVVPDPYVCLPDRATFHNVAVVGAGIAGACVANAFARRGYRVRVFDAASGPASGASGNPLGLVMPRIDAADTMQARLLLQCYFRALQFYAHLDDEAKIPVTARHFAQNDKERTRFEKVLADPPLDESWLTGEWVNDGPVLLHHGAMMVRPTKVVEALLDHPNISCVWNAPVSEIDTLRNDMGEAALVIVTAGWTSGTMMTDAGLSLAGKLGQVDWADQLVPCVTSARADGSYIIRTDNTLLFGATFERVKAGETPDCSEEARQSNLEAAMRLAPDWMQDVDRSDLKSRASVRGTTPDRMPIAGVLFETGSVLPVLGPLAHGIDIREPVPHQPLNYTLTGLGARGFTFAPLLADLIVSQVLGEPLPLARSEVEQVSPLRFLIRAVRKGTTYP